MSDGSEKAAIPGIRRSTWIWTGVPADAVLVLLCCGGAALFAFSGPEGAASQESTESLAEQLPPVGRAASPKSTASIQAVESSVAQEESR